MEETVFFNEGNVSVSNSRFIVNGQTYAMSSVTSVKKGETPPDKTMEIIFVILCVLIIAFASAAWKIGALVVGAYLINLIRNKKTIYSVVLNVSSGEMQALQSHDKAFIERIIEALNQAIVSRG